MTSKLAVLTAAAVVIALGGVAAYALSASQSKPGAPEATPAQALKISEDGSALAFAALRLDQAELELVREGAETPATEREKWLSDAREATESLISICRAQPLLVIEGHETIKEYLEDQVKSLHTPGEDLAERRDELKLALEQHCG